MPATQFRMFISSVQKELAKERRALRAFVEGDPLLSRFFTVFLFEGLPASDRRADAAYLAEVDRCAVYVGLFGNEYGFEDTDGISPTEREFNRATSAGKHRLIFVKGSDDTARRPKMRALVRKAGKQLIRRRFNNIPELTAALNASLVDYLEASGVIQAKPFEERPSQDATIADVDTRAVAEFVRLAQHERQFPLPEKTPAADVLAHLHLLSGQHPTHAAILLFGRDPQRFLPAAEVRCMHFHGIKIQRPVPFYRIFKGTLFEQVGMSVDFVLSKLNRSVGTRAASNQAPVRYEIPPDVIREAIVNAVAHRDYASAGAVQVSVFADRVEVWNPGTLPVPLTPESLRRPHGSIARNHRICEALFLARYIEKYGTGTLMMIRESLAHALPEPDFTQCGGEFTITLWRNWLTEEVLTGFHLTERQMQAVVYLKTNHVITNSIYQSEFKASKRTASRDLDEMLSKGILEKVGTTGKGVHYRLGKGAAKGPKGPTIDSQRAQTTHRCARGNDETYRTAGITMAKIPKNTTGSKKSVEALTHEEAKRKNIPTAEYQSVLQKAEQDPVRVAYKREAQGLAEAVQTQKTRCYGPTALMACDEYACGGRKGANGK